MNKILLPLIFLLSVAGLTAQPQEFMPAPCFGPNNTMFYLAFLDQVGTGVNAEPVESGVDYVAAIDAEGYVIGVTQVANVSGAFGCPQSAAVNLAIAGTDNSPGSSCPASPYGASGGDLIDIVIYDNSRDAFFSLANQVTFQSGTGGTANSGGCPQESFPIPYVVPSNPLPVVLSAFRGQANDRGEVELGWTTVLEQNSDVFSIEHSRNGEAWRAIGEVAAAGNSQGERNYSFVDATPNNGQNLYRLRQVDFDGSFYYSEVVSVNMETVGGVKEAFAYPNPPVNNQFTLTLSGNWSNETTSTLNDISGRQVASWANVTSGTNTIDLPNLPAGIYQLVTADATTTTTIRVVLR